MSEFILAENSDGKPICLKRDFIVSVEESNNLLFITVWLSNGQSRDSHLLTISSFDVIVESMATADKPIVVLHTDRDERIALRQDDIVKAQDIEGESTEVTYLFRNKPLCMEVQESAEQIEQALSIQTVALEDRDGRRMLLNKEYVCSAEEIEDYEYTEVKIMLRDRPQEEHVKNSVSEINSLLSGPR